MAKMNFRTSARRQTHPQPLPGGEHASARSKAVPLLGGVRGGFFPEIYFGNRSSFGFLCVFPPSCGNNRDEVTHDTRRSLEVVDGLHAVRIAAQARAGRRSRDAPLCGALR